LREGIKRGASVREAFPLCIPRQSARNQDASPVLIGPIGLIGLIHENKSKRRAGGAFSAILFGLVAKTGYSQPWFDENGGVYPVYHAIKGLAASRGRPLLDLGISKPREIQAIGTVRDGAVEIWVANLTDQTKSVDIVPKSVFALAVLSAAEFERATQDTSVMDALERRFSNEALTLPAYAVARFRSRP
jgi:D-apionolactonase